MKRKICIITILFFIIFSLAIAHCYAHSGRTDSSGGHKDNKNVSGLGSYHYHCGGYPAHLHTNGVCPYSSNSYTTQTYTPTEVTTIDAEKVEIQNGEIKELKVGQTLTLSAVVSPSNTTDKSITWTSNNENVVKIDSNGKIDAIANGTAKITVKTSNGISDTIEVKVEKKLESISICEDKTTLEVGEEYQLEYTITPSDVEANCIWTSSDESIVTVNSNGKIKAQKSGSTFITVNAGDNVKDRIVITVKSEITEVTPKEEKDDSEENAVFPLIFLGGCVASGIYIINDRRKK